MSDSLSEAVISASRVPEIPTEVPRSLYIIQHEEVNNSSARSVAELLEGAVGVDVRQRGIMGAQSDLSIRGSSFDQTLVLINGVRMSDPQTGHHQMNLTIEPEDIERIEVLHGGASRVLGPNAFAGAVNIITRNPGVSGFRIRTAGGEHGLGELSASGALAFANHSHRISFGRRTADGFFPNTDLKLRNYFLQSELRSGRHSLTVMAGRNEKEFGAQNFYTSLFPLQFEATRAEFVSATEKWETEHLQIRAIGYFRRHFDRFELFREGADYYQRTATGVFVMQNDTAPSWYQGHNYHRTEVYGFELNAAYLSKWGKTSLGADYRNESVWSNVLGEMMKVSMPVPGEPDFALYTKSDDRQNISVYAEHTLNKGKHRMSAGILLNLNSAYGTEWYPGADYGFRLSEVLMPYASVNRSLRFPTFTDLYYNRGGAVGSRDLKPESSVNYELGGRLTFRGVSGHLAAFLREGRNLIDWIRFEGSDTTKAANITQVNIWGLESSWSFDFDKFFNKKGLPVVGVSYAFMESDTGSTGFESNYVLDFLRHKVGLTVRQPLTETVNLSVSFSHQQRIGSFRSDGEMRAFEPFSLLDIRLAHTDSHVTLFAEVTNLLNQRVSDIGNVLLPGRWLRAGIAVNVSAKKASDLR